MHAAMLANRPIIVLAIAPKYSRRKKPAKPPVKAVQAAMTVAHRGGGDAREGAGHS